MNPENNPPATPEQQAAEEVFYDTVEELDELKAELARLMEKVDKIQGYISQTEKFQDKLASEVEKPLGKLTADLAANPDASAPIAENPAAPKAEEYYLDSQGRRHNTREEAILADRPA